MSNHRDSSDGSREGGCTAQPLLLEDYCFRQELSERFELVFLVLTVITPTGLA